MILGIFCIYDTGISTWLPPLYFRNKGEALRWWVDVANNPESKMAKHPQDYNLFEVGTWDDDSNQFKIHIAPIKLGTAMEFARADLSSRAADILPTSSREISNAPDKG